MIFVLIWRKKYSLLALFHSDSCTNFARFVFKKPARFAFSGGKLKRSLSLTEKHLLLSTKKNIILDDRYNVCGIYIGMGNKVCSSGIPSVLFLKRSITGNILLSCLLGSCPHWQSETLVGSINVKKSKLWSPLHSRKWWLLSCPVQYVSHAAVSC